MAGVQIGRVARPLQQIGRAAGLSPNHLLRGYRALFGRTPHQQLIELRLARAAELLRAGDASVSEVCLAVGFSSLGSFSALFRRRMGCAPQAYRRRTG